MRQLLLSLLICAALLTSHGSWSAEELSAFQVIVHPENPVTSLPRTQVSKILLKSVSRWEKGRPVEPVNQNPKSPVRQSFSKQVHKRSVTSIESYWQRQIFSGRDVPPAVLDSDQEVIEFVKSQVGGIGYISAETPTDGVKVLTLTD